MNLPGSSSTQRISRRHFLKTGACGAAGLALYSGEFERHWIETTQRDITLRGLPAAFDGMKIAQLSDIHLDEFTEPFLLRDAVDRINRMQVDAVFLTGDYISAELLSKKRTLEAAWQCAGLLNELACKQRYAVLGNHDLLVGADEVSEALANNDIRLLRNSYVPLERGSKRVWLAGTDDPTCGSPDLDQTVPAAIRDVNGEPVMLLCHAPDYVDRLRKHPAASSVAFVLSGHTHGGQVRLPVVGPLRLPPWGKKYVEGLFQFGGLQLYVNRGLGTVGLPFRFDCPPEISFFTLRAA